MPRMNGLEATRILRPGVPDTKVVIISQNEPEVARCQGGEVDAAAYISKSDLSPRPPWDGVQFLDPTFQCCPF